MSDDELERRLRDLERGRTRESLWRFGWSGALTFVAYLLTLSQMASCDRIKALQREAEIAKRAEEQAKQSRLEIQLEEAMRRLDTLGRKP